MAKSLIFIVAIVLVTGGLILAIAKPTVAPTPQVTIHDVGTTSLVLPAPTFSHLLSRRTDLGGMNMSVGGEADLLVMDSGGRRTGFDPTSRAILKEIPLSIYESDALGSDEEVGVPTEMVHSIHVNQPHDGIYTVVLTGLEVGQYTLLIRTFAEDGKAQPAIHQMAQIMPGSQVSFQLKYTSAPDTVSILSELPFLNPR